MECPNCGAHIGRFELDQNCKSCGVNLFYCRQEKLLSTDAKRCELEYASFRILVAKLKASFIKGAYPIARIVLTLACIGVVFIPTASMNVNIPLFSHSISFGGYGMYQSFSDGSLLALFDFLKIDTASEVAAPALALDITLLLIVLVSLTLLLAELLSFIDIMKSAKAMTVISGIGMLVSAYSTVQAIFLKNAAQVFSEGFVRVSVGFGGVAAMLAFLLAAAVNVMIIKSKISPQFKEVDLERVKMHKRVKCGEVSLDDLPLPVFEFEEEKQKRLEIEEKLTASEKATAGGGGVE